MKNTIIKVQRESDNMEIKIDLSDEKQVKLLEEFCKGTNGFLSFITNQK